MIAFIAVVVHKVVLNVISFLRIKRILKLHLKYLAGEQINFIEYQPAIEDLLKRAHIEDCSVHRAEWVTPTQFVNRQVWVILNAHNKEVEIAAHIHGMLQRAKAKYKTRMLEALNPLYWIDVVIFLPKHVALYFGKDADKLSVKISQVVWWILAPVATLARSEIYSWFSALFSQ